MPKSLSNLLTLLLALIGCGVATILTVEHFTHHDTGCFKSGEGCATTIGSAYGQVAHIPTAAFGLAMYVTLVALCLLRSKQLRLARDREANRAAAYASSVMEVSSDSGLEDTTLDSNRPEPELRANTGSSFDSFSQAQADVLPVSASVADRSVRNLDMAVWGISLLGFGISLWLQYVAIYQLQSFCKFCFTSAIVIALIFALASRDYLLDGRRLTGEQKMLGGVLAVIAVLGSFIIIPDIQHIIDESHRVVEKPTSIGDPDKPPSEERIRKALLDSIPHVKGDPAAKCVLIEFADYQCGHCALTAPMAEKPLQEYPKDIKLAFRNFPLPMHPWARMAAQAAEAAGEQGKFWEMHDLLFKNQKDMEVPTFVREQFDGYARQLKLDIAKFDQDMNSDAIMNRVAQDLAAGNLGQVQSTPTFFFVSPHHVTRFAGGEELGKFMQKPHTKDWE